MQQTTNGKSDQRLVNFEIYYYDFQSYSRENKEIPQIPDVVVDDQR